MHVLCCHMLGGGAVGCRPGLLAFLGCDHFLAATGCEGSLMFTFLGHMLDWVYFSMCDATGFF